MNKNIIIEAITCSTEFFDLFRNNKAYVNQPAVDKEAEHIKLTGVSNEKIKLFNALIS